MLQIYIYQSRIWRIVEKSALFIQVFIESLAIVGCHLFYHRQICRLCLQYHQSLLTLTACSTAHLLQHHIRMFVGTEVGIVEHRVGIQYSYQLHTVEIQSLCYHLCAYQHICFSVCKVFNNPCIRILGASSIKIHTCHLGFGE